MLMSLSFGVHSQDHDNVHPRQRDHSMYVQAAKTLQDSGRCNVTLLEASGEVGGRAQTIVVSPLQE